MDLYFGDNQYQGVSHLKGNSGHYQQRFLDSSAVANHLTQVANAGISDFAFTCTDKVKKAVSEVQNLQDLALHPSLPYAYDVNAKISKLGLTSAFVDECSQVGLYSIARALVKVPFARYQAVWELLISSQLSSLDLSRIKSVGLLNIAFDFLLGLGRADIIRDFYLAVKALTGKDVWFYSMNSVRAIEVLRDNGMVDAFLVTNINTAGFRMNPSQSEVFSALRQAGRPNVIAMSVFAGDGLSEAFREILLDTELQGVLFGGANLDNVSSNIERLRSFVDRGLEA